MRYTKHHKTAEIAKLPRGIIAGSVATLALVLGALILTAPQPSKRKALPDFAMPSPAVSASSAAPVDDKPLRLVYRNSVVPGGVHSAAELAAIIKRDPIAAAHYAGFNVAKAHLVQVEQSRMVHVSYRIGNQIYWTKNKVRLALNEYLLSDGEHLIRARCGNRIADTVQGPVLLHEPAPEVLETAFVSADDLIDNTVSMAALGGLPAQPDLTSASTTAAAPVAGAPARSTYWDRFGMPALVSIPTLPGVTVVGGRTAPALLVDSVVTGEPLPTAPSPVVTSPVAAEPVGSTPTTPVTPVTPAPPLLSVPDTLPVPAAPPIDVKTDLPAPADPSGPFIEPPVFTPTVPIIPTVPVDASVPEPGGIVLACMALLILVVARRLARDKR